MMSFLARFPRLTIATIVAAASLMAGPNAGAQEDVDRLVYQFNNGDIQAKVVILEQIADEPATDVAPVYGAALGYALSAMDEIGVDARFRGLALETVNRIGEAGYTEALQRLWRLFLAYPGNSVRIAVLNVLGELGIGDRQTVVYVTEWIISQVAIAGSGRAIDDQVLYAAVDAAVQLGDPSSGEALIRAALAGRSASIARRAEEGLAAIAETNPDAVIELVTSAETDVLAARTDYLVGLSGLPLEFRSRLADAALRDATTTIIANAQDRAALRSARSISAAFLTETRYADATPAVIAHFNKTVAEYGDNTVGKAVLIEAIRAAGAMGTDAAAARLSDFLRLANTYTEYERPFDTRLVLETIAAIERTQSEEGHDDIYYVTLLDYPDVVIDAARGALQVIGR